MERITVSPPFTVTSVIEDGCHVLALNGELDVAETGKLEAALDACTNDLPIIADLSNLDFLDSSGLHVLFDARETAQPVALVCPPDSNIARTLNIVTMIKALPVFDDLPAALAYIGFNS